MNENTLQFNKAPALDKKGKSILIASLVVALVLIVAGIIVLAVGSAKHLTVEEGFVYTLDTKNDRIYKVHFTPEYSGAYVIELSDAYLSDVYADNGNYVSRSYGTAKYYNIAYKVYLSRNVEYVIEVDPSYSQAKFIIYED